jgi:integrase/recombinase XerD
MVEQKVTVSLFLDASRVRKDGTSLIKLNVYYKPDKARYPTDFHVTKDDWTKMNAPNLRDDKLRQIKKKLNALKDHAEKEIAKITPFSFSEFEEVFYGNEKAVVSKGRKLEAWFDDTIDRLDKNDQVGTAGSYKTTKNSITLFRKNLLLQDITPTFLTSYEKHLLAEGKSVATVGIYMRNLRAIINEAIEAKLIHESKYPFKHYQIPTGQNVKKALKDDQIDLLLNHRPGNLDHQKALDFWLLSYLCSGINFADIISLKPDNIDGRHLYFRRKKTIRTKKKDLRPIHAGLNTRAIEIIDRWRNTDTTNPYLFSILEEGLGAKTIKNKCQRFIKWVNAKMYEICDDLKIEHKTSTYAARHSFSTVMKRRGVPTSFIKDALGHSTESMTENYLDSFEDEVKLEYADLLTQFPKRDELNA